jgi:hypothetical protein
LKKRAISVTPAGVRTIWLRYDLPTFQLRLKTLSAKVAQEGIILTEDQVRALEKAKQEKEAHGSLPGVLCVSRTVSHKTTWHAAHTKLLTGSAGTPLE